MYHNPDERYPGVTIHGQKVTVGDLWGIYDEDPIVGYTLKKHAVSLHGLWQSNNVGARSQEDTPKNILPGKQRIILFGESFTNCSRIPQEESWPFFLNYKDSNVEFLNFGVDGYSMGQCLLRYKIIKKEIDYDMVMFVFVPRADLWREINVWRRLYGWDEDCIMPRFVVEGDQLKLVTSPYRTFNDLNQENSSHISAILKNHLRLYDRFYFRARFESPPLIGESIFYKLLAKKFVSFQRRYLLDSTMKIDSEAMTVTLKIFETIHEIAKHDGKQFIVVYLPTKPEIVQYKNNLLFRKQWDAMVSFAAKKGIVYIDLMRDLGLCLNQLDSPDGAHYGPRANKIISELLWRHFRLMSHDGLVNLSLRDK